MKKSLSLFVILALLLSSMGILAGAEEICTGRAAGDYVTSSHAKLPFEDIDPAAWYVEGLTFCYTNNVISGAGNTYTFSPRGTLTRATFAVMLARAVGADLSVTPWNTFDDCDYRETSWYAKAVEWAAINEYMVGTSETSFSPNGAMTREQLATVFMRFMKKAGCDVQVADGLLNEYTDAASVSSWAKEGVEYAIAAGLISSTSTAVKTASPAMTVTRDQASRMFMVFLRDYFYGDCEHDMAAATCESASACTKCGMAQGLPTGHTCTTLSCNAGSQCITCGADVSGDAGLHSFANATCTAPRTCTVCGETRGAKLGHKFTSATCTKPKTCTVCGATEGTAGGHKFSQCKCTVCGFDAFGDASYYLALNEGFYTDVSASGYAMEFYAFYDFDTGEVIFYMGGYYESGAYDALMFSINRSGTEAQFDYEYYVDYDDEEALFDGYGKFDPRKFKSDAWLVFTDYIGNSSDVATALDNIRFIGDEMMKTAAEVFAENISHVTMPMLGFTNY